MFIEKNELKNIINLVLKFKQPSDTDYKAYLGNTISRLETGNINLVKENNLFPCLFKKRKPSTRILYFYLSAQSPTNILRRASGPFRTNTSIVPAYPPSLDGHKYRKYPGKCSLTRIRSRKNTNSRNYVSLPGTTQKGSTGGLLNEAKRSSGNNKSDNGSFYEDNGAAWEWLHVSARVSDADVPVFFHRLALSIASSRMNRGRAISSLCRTSRFPLTNEILRFQTLLSAFRCCLWTTENLADVYPVGSPSLIRYNTSTEKEHTGAG